MPRNHLEGEVISDKMQKTVVVAVDSLRQHPTFLKKILRTKKFKAHNELGAKVGDWVRIQETRPKSCKKRFKVVEVLKKGTK